MAIQRVGEEILCPEQGVERDGPRGLRLGAQAPGT